MSILFKAVTLVLIILQIGISLCLYTKVSFASIDNTYIPSDEDTTDKRYLHPCVRMAVPSN